MSTETQCLQTPIGGGIQTKESPHSPLSAQSCNLALNFIGYDFHAGEAGEPSPNEAAGGSDAAAPARPRGRGRGGRGNNRPRGPGGAQRNPPASSTASVAPKEGINPLPANAGQGWD